MYAQFVILCFIYLTGPEAIGLDCSLTVNAELTVFSYSCEVILGDGQQDTLVCDVDDAPRVPCKFPITKHETAFPNSTAVKVVSLCFRTVLS